ncbi:MAG: excisionase family DNA binding protein [Candidatus Omnitrophota bacterium]|jgi:excisionase family DNA binding protein
MKTLERPVIEKTKEIALSTEEACNFLNISRQTLYKLVRTKQIPGHRFGDKHFFFESEILVFFKHGI